MSNSVIIFNTRRRDYNQRDQFTFVIVLIVFVSLLFTGLNIWKKLIGLPLIGGWVYLWSLNISKITIQDNGVYLHKLFRTEKIEPDNVLKIYFNPQISMESAVRLLVIRPNGKKKNFPLFGELFEYENLIKNFSELYKIDQNLLVKLKKNKVTW